MLYIILEEGCVVPWQIIQKENVEYAENCSNRIHLGRQYVKIYTINLAQYAVS